jgi:hypothetical protein
VLSIIRPVRHADSPNTRNPIGPFLSLEVRLLESEGASHLF